MKPNPFTPEAAGKLRRVSAVRAGVMASCSGVGLRFGAASVALFMAIGAARAVTPPLEFRQHLTPFNYVSEAGMPLSPDEGDPPGSDGRAPTPGEQGERGLTTSDPSPGQFRGFVTFGAVVRTRPPSGTAEFSSYSAYAQQVLPHGGPSGSEMYLARAQVGSPYVSRRTAFLFGSIIPVPATDEHGELLTPPQRPEDYWLAEPYPPEGGHEEAPYYWSPHARTVFAIHPGPIQITWRRATPLPGVLPDHTVTGGSGTYQDDTDNYVIVGGRVYVLYTQQHIVSGSPVKPPRRMYWTEGVFRSSGLPIDVHEGVMPNFVYTDKFPRQVDEAYQPPGVSPPVAPGEDGSIYTERRTIFYNQDTASIHAYNWQGRILLELLGDSVDGTRQQHLGYEIVDVVRRVNPADVAVELGERLTAWQDGNPDDAHLLPRMLQRSRDHEFVFQHIVEGARVQIYAIRETININDFLLHWTEEGIEGLRWPFRFVRYKMVWPDDITKYSHYMRPLVANEQEARETAVPLPTENVPIIEYQDPLDRPRGKLTDTFAFFTHLEPQFPIHRTLLRFTSGDYIAFERVFSWLADALTIDSEQNLLAAGRLAEMLGLPPGPNGVEQPKMLSAWDPVSGTLTTPDSFMAPRVVERTVEVAQRVEAPIEPDMPGADDYWAGHIRVDKGDSFNPWAYVDPFESGFEEANQGAIIPVNAIPGDNSLEVWWFRANFSPNSPMVVQGFQPIYWPSIIDRRTIVWPSNPREIVLASNHGSGPLSSLEARGTIYAQNNPDQAGYNPNEEHALMVGGQAYALRDDLNLTEPGPDYSSDPFVLLDYKGADGRPAMAAFRVLREKPESGWVFDYVVEAGTILQAPMPLPLLPAPVEGEGAHAVNYNAEPGIEGAGDLPGNWDATLHGDGTYGHYPRFTFKDRKDAFWVYRGLHAGPPPLEAGSYDPDTEAFLPLPTARVQVDEPFRYVIHASQQTEALQMLAADETPLPAWLHIDGIALVGTPPAADTHEITLILNSIIDGSSVELSLTIEAEEEGGPPDVQEELELVSTNPHTGTTVTHIGRPPFLAVDPAAENSFTMRFYYKSREGFAWPGIADPPPLGSIVPYLRPDGSAQPPHSKETESLDIVYRPTWPVDTPGIRLGDTLTTPKEGLPAVRGQTSVRVLYQQSLAADVDAERVSVILHDSTRDKEASIVDFGLDELPAGVRTDRYQGRLYFPNLPPHLIERLFFDPFRGENGHLVFQGEFRRELFGADYLLLNVLRDNDLNSVLDLCPEGDADKTAWDNLVLSLAAMVETFHENPDVPGQFIPNPSRTVSVGIGDIVEINDHNTAVDSYALSASGPGYGYVTLMVGGGAAFSPPAEPVSLHIIRVEPVLFPGELKVIAATNPLNEHLTMQHSPDLGGRFSEYEYDWRIGAPVDGFPPTIDDDMAQWVEVSFGPGLPLYTLGGASVRTLSDNYLVVRYRPLNPDHPLYNDWSPWTSPMLAEGWIKRVLAGINPFRQRTTDLFNNEVSTDVSMLTQAGPRWEGDVALNLENIDDFGLIEIYETVLRRGRMLSIDAGINYGPANDALLLAAGYLNDLYIFVGNEAWADAANPTIGIGTADKDYGDIATSMFAFRGQVATLLDEELALMRGRDDFMLPGVKIAPVYNRLVWNYTRGIDAGEVIYAINYNIQEKPDGEPTGIIDASDAVRMFPQGHGDAYGHYLTALKGYYSLLMSPNFDWVPRIEAVLVLGQPVSVDYMDERKFAAAAAAVARSGRQTFDLTWRKDYKSDKSEGWEHFGATRHNDRTERTRYWGMDHWATRTGQGAYINWIVGNAILPDQDPDPDHEGIQKIDRTTVPELTELAVVMEALQTALNNAEAGLTPLGLPEGGIAFDINPQEVAGGRTHFEQMYDRALRALHNAVAAFDDAKDVTRLMRSEEDSLADLQTQVSQQEHAYRNALIELYGTPYPDDIGPGRTYQTGYDGPDLLHFMYVDLPQLPGGHGLVQGDEKKTFQLNVQNLPGDWRTRLYTDFDFYIAPGSSGDGLNGTYVEYELGSHGFFGKPDHWTGKRRSPGQVQQAISELIAAHNALAQALNDGQSARNSMARKVNLFEQRLETNQKVRSLERDILIAKQTLDSVKLAFDLVDVIMNATKTTLEGVTEAMIQAMPVSFIAGMAAGGDLTSPARAGFVSAGATLKTTLDWVKIGKFIGVTTLGFATTTAERWVKFDEIAPLLSDQKLREEVTALGSELSALSSHLVTINQRLRELDDAERKYRALVAEGDRLLEEREIFRRRAATVVQGFRTRDAAFRIFRHEKLERYKTLFDLAAQYAYLAAQAYDYDTGLLHTPEGRAFIDGIVGARALGVVSGGQPQFAGSGMGDPGLSSALAVMKADWSVLRGRLGFNNPDTYGTTVSLRREAFRVAPDEDSDNEWKDILNAAWRSNLLDDADVRRSAMQVGADGFPVPGLVIEFSTTIAPGRNLFGHRLAPGDHAFSPSSFATKIFAVGVALEGYIGMSDPAANSFSVQFAGGESQADLQSFWLNPDALAATPYIYLIPVGADSMRSPPLGDVSTIRTWNVSDVTVPLPFNIGASQFSTLQWWQSSDFLTDRMFGVRKHQAFRPVSAASVFGYSGDLKNSQYTNNRLIGRSVWNSKWKLVIPGDTLLNDPEEGLRRFIRSVHDIQLHYITYSHAGN